MSVSVQWIIPGQLIYTRVSGTLSTQEADNASRQVVELTNTYPENRIGWLVEYTENTRPPTEMRLLMQYARRATSPHNMEIVVIYGPLQGPLRATVKVLTRLMPHMHYRPRQDEAITLLQTAAPHLDLTGWQPAIQRQGNHGE